MAITIFLFLSLNIFKIVIKPLSANSNICAIEELISFPLDYRSHFFFFLSEVWTFKKKFLDIVQLCK